MDTQDDIGVLYTRAERKTMLNFWTVVDFYFSSFFIAPLVIAFWSSTWSLLSAILFVFLAKDEMIMRASVTLGFGFVILFLFTWYQKKVKAIFTKRVKDKFLFFLASRLYTEILGIASVSSWYGIWIAVDLLTGPRLNTILAVLIVSYLILVFTRSSINLKSSPYVMVLDRKVDYFDAPTLLQSLWARKEEKLLLLDVIFSILIVNTLVCLVWKGTWFLLDEIMYFKEEILSSLLSLGVGYGVLCFTFVVQPVILSYARKAEGWKRLIIVDIYIFIAIFANINIWRGVWDTLQYLTHLENSLGTTLIVHVVSFCLLITFRVSNTILLRGAYSESVKSAAECVEFSSYFNLEYKVGRAKTTIKIEEAEQNGDDPDDTNENPRDVTECADPNVPEFCLQEIKLEQ